MEVNQQERDEIEINLVELAKELWSKKGIIFLSAAILGLAVILFNKLMITPQYESTTKLYVLAKQDGVNVTNGDLQASTLLTKDYAELIKSRKVSETVINNLGLDMNSEALLGKMSVAAQPDTRIVTIKITDKDPYLACQLANEVRNVAAQHIQEVMNIEAVNVAEEANIPEHPVGPRTKRNGAMGALLGGVAAAAVVLMVYLMNDTIKTSEDVERYLGLSTLGTIPLSEEDHKGRKKKNKKVRRK